MKNITLFVGVAALLLGCSGLAGAQCAGEEQFAGFDLLQTTGGSQDNLTSIGLTGDPPGPNGEVTFTGVALPRVTITGTAVSEVGTTDTIMCRFNPLPTPLPTPAGAKVTIQVVALELKGDALYQPAGQPTATQVTVYATINQTRNQSLRGRYAFCRDLTSPPDVCSDPNNVLPEPTPNPGAYPQPSSGQMTVFSDGTFNTDNLNIQADLIIVPRNGAVTDKPIAVLVMPLDQMSSSGSKWSTTEPSGYPNSTTFPAGGFFVSDPTGGLAAVVPLLTSRILRGSLYGLGFILLGIAVLKIRSGINSGRLTLQPVYLMGLAAIAWFVGWKSSKLVFPTIAHAQAVATTCAPHTMSAFFNENGTVVVHKVVTAVCTPST